jgi:alkanesulfonate monooxygenase SsuD/methylene tetrahydromethanopterin reductase-like flavin-dependent oxidoreductase (luciferase family)
MEAGMGDAQAMKYSIFSVQDHYPSEQRSVQQLYGQVIDQAVLAEELGYDTFFVAEHHFHEYGVVPNPAVMLAALSQRTTTLRLGSAISIATFHHPLTLAENYAMVDTLSGGRLVYGVGSGYLPHEYAGYKVDPQTKRFRFDENLALVERALAGERITFTGEWNDLEDVAINVPTVQRPTPPVYVAILRKEVAFHIGRQGRGILAVPYASTDDVSEIAGMVSEYERGLADAGHDGGDAVFALHCHVAETDEQARAVAEQPFDRYVDSRLYARKQTYDDVLRSGLGLFGSVEKVTEQLVGLHEMGVRHVMFLQNFGLMPQDDVQRSMRMLATEVMPRVTSAVGASVTA